MYDEPHKGGLNHEAYWPSRPLDELLEKAQVSSEKAYSGLIGMIAFLELALDRMKLGSERGADIADVMEKASCITRMLTELRQNVTKLTPKKRNKIVASLQSSDTYKVLYNTICRVT